LGLLEQFNVLCLDPRNPDSFPDGLLDALGEHSGANYVFQTDGDGTQRIESRLRRQMKADALLPLRADISEIDDEPVSKTQCDYSSETLDEVLRFLQLNVRTWIFSFFVSEFSHSISTGKRSLAASATIPP
jgi:hypothetical protein